MVLFFSLLLSVSVLQAAAGTQVADTKFMVNRGFRRSPVTVMIRSGTTSAKIRYTTDGSAPTPDYGLGNTNPVAVPVEKTTVLRAIAYKEGMIPSNVDTQTYIFLEDVLRQEASIPGYPDPRMASGADRVRLDYEMDPAIVDHPDYRQAIKKGLLSIPTLSIVVNKDDMFGYGGVYFARDGLGPTVPASVEILYPDQPGKSFQVDCALESHARPTVKRSLKLKFKREFGPAKLESSVFQEAVLNENSATDTHDRIVLRAGNGRSFAIGFQPDRTSYVRDQWARDAQIAVSGLGSHGIFVHLYVNGLYWGLYNACERPDAWFASNYFGGQMEDWFSVNHHGPRSGDPVRWDYLRGPLKDKDLRVQAHYEEIEQYLDVTHFADYLILCWLMGLGDWPFNNWYGANRNHPASPFQFFVWDAEKSWSELGPQQPPGTRRSADEPWRIRQPFRSSERRTGGTMVGIWHSLRKNKDFMMLFADRVYKHCYNDGALTDDHSLARWRTLAGSIADAVVAESARWGDARGALGEQTRTRDDTFYPEVDRVVSRMEGSVEKFIEALRVEGYYPPIDPPLFSHSGGPTPPELVLTMRNPNQAGTLYYTVNGIDPRAPGGGIAVGSVAAGDLGTLQLSGSMTVKARIKRGRRWSAIHEVRFCVEDFWTRLLQKILPTAARWSRCQ